MWNPSMCSSGLCKGGWIFQNDSGFEPVGFLIGLDKFLVNWGRYPSIRRGRSCFRSNNTRMISDEGVN